MRNPLIKRMYKVLLEKGFEGTYINKVYQEGYVLIANIHLPEDKERSELENILKNLQQEFGATAVKIGKQSGKYFEIHFGMNKLKNVNFDQSMLFHNSLKVMFPSAYGEKIIDFEDGASCHMLNGGVTRMGKTCFLLYLCTVLFLQNGGKMKLFISSAKLKDYYPFDLVPSVMMAKDHAGMIQMLDIIVEEYKTRNELLYSPQFRMATDAKSVRKLYPDQYDKFAPIFLIIDEYARFADSTVIQDKVTELVETAGFVNIHVIIASQRPDASTVLKPRIRANLLARMAFTTADKKNSEIILDRYGAEELGQIAGRGLLVDSDTNVIQVPFIEAPECDRLLRPYQVELKLEEEKEDDVNEQEHERRIDTESTDEIQSLFEESDSLDDLSGELKSSKRSKPSTKKNVIVWGDFPNPERA